MFTGAVYLCSVLHFAPAEPPVSYIRWLMYLTNGFPVVIGLTYIIVRTIHEPSPLNILVKVPYYHLMGDMKQVDYLWASQLTCWTGQSKYDYIEEIADSPNYVLVIVSLSNNFFSFSPICVLSLNSLSKHKSIIRIHSSISVSLAQWRPFCDYSYYYVPNNETRFNTSRNESW